MRNEKLHHQYEDAYDRAIDGIGNAHKAHEAALAEVEKEIRNQALEDAAVRAWSIGMDLHMQESDTREVGSKIAKGIRELKSN